jgi:aspartate/methionine/tyrosine aminotransferase
MRLQPYALDRWLHRHRNLPLNLASSTGPSWTVEELLALSPHRGGLGRIKLGYGDTDGSPSLRRAIAGLYGAVDPDQVQVTFGAQEALLIAFALAAEPGANIVLPDPCFPGISELARAFGLEPRRYRLLPSRRFELAAEDVEALLDRHTRLVVINSPHNPTGAVVEPDVLLRLADAARVVGARLLCDEVYHPLRSDREASGDFEPSASALGISPVVAVEPLSAADLVPEALVLGDLSKALSLPGLRLGWLIDRDPRSRLRAFDAHAYFCIAQSPLSEHLAEIALEQRHVILARCRAAIAANRAALSDFAARHDHAVACILPRGGTTAFPWLTGVADARPFCEAMVERGVLLAPGDCFGSPAHFRVGLGGDPETFARGLEGLAEELAQTRRAGQGAGSSRIAG